MTDQAAALFGPAGAGGDYAEAHLIQDAASGLRAVLVLHDERLGPAAGGVRRRAYASDADAFADARRLAHAMTLKCALADLPAGGAKTVMLDHAHLDRVAAYRALARHVERLGGRYLAGPDVGTTEDDIATMRAVTRHVNPAGNDPGGCTARGVIAGLHAVLEALDGDRGFAGRSFAVQGLGSVGGAVARALVAEGGSVVGADVADAACAEAAKAGVRIVPTEALLAESVDVFVPCALGGVIDDAVARMLRARAVCGSANNPLATPLAGSTLHARGVVYAPDIVVNAGAVIEGVITTRDGATAASRADAATRVDAIESRLRAILRLAAEQGVTPDAAAVVTAEARLAETV